MKKSCLAIYTVIILFIAFWVGPGLIMAQGTSPVKVNKITTSPASFKAGNTVSISIEIENTARSNYGCVGEACFQIFVQIFKARPPIMTNFLFETTLSLNAALSAGEKKTITFPARWVVPNIDTDKFIFNATGPICAPDEFGQMLSKTFLKSCSYSATSTIELIRIHKKDLIRK